MAKVVSSAFKAIGSLFGFGKPAPPPAAVAPPPPVALPPPPTPPPAIAKPKPLPPPPKPKPKPAPAKAKPKPAPPSATQVAINKAEQAERKRLGRAATIKTSPTGLKEEIRLPQLYDAKPGTIRRRTLLG